MECTQCGACCVAPDIAALDKPLGLRCPHLLGDNRCAIYERRPQICRDYAPDELCRRIEAPTLEERVAKYLALFDLGDEAERIRAGGCASMGAARPVTGHTTPLGTGGESLRSSPNARAAPRKVSAP